MIMYKTLITRLNGVANNDSLPKLGELKIKFTKGTKSGNRNITLKFSQKTEIKISGDSAFSSGSKTTTLNVDQQAQLAFNNMNEMEISFPKYNLVYLAINITDGGTAKFDIGNLKYSKLLEFINVSNTDVYGDISSISGLENLNGFRVGNTKVYGDLAAVSNLLKLTVIDVGNSNISGDLSAISNLSKLAYVYMQNSRITGNLSAISNLSSLAYVYMQNSRITGNLSAISNLSSLVRFEASNLDLVADVSAVTNLSDLLYLYVDKLKGNINTIDNLQNLRVLVSTAAELTGDLALLPSSMYRIELSKATKSSFSWSDRPSSAKVLSIYGSMVLSNIDKMLIDNAKCEVPTAGDNNTKNFYIIGKRTAASDSAVQTLQSKGYSVWVVES